jgi:hypothetical protein
MPIANSQQLKADSYSLSDSCLIATLVLNMIIPHLHRLQTLKNPTVIVGILISLIVLSLGVFLYMMTEGDEEASSLASQTQSTSSSLAILEASVQGEPMMISEGQEHKPFIMALIPGSATLEDGIYKSDAGTKLRVRVRAINVENGVLYFKPTGSKEVQVQESEKVGDLVPSELPGEYEAFFDIKDDTSGILVALMKGKDGQEVRLSVNVATRR